MIGDFVFPTRPPDMVCGISIENPFLRRWYISQPKEGQPFTVYMNQFCMSEKYPDLHDHPWDNVSIILRGGYWEITPEGRFWRAPGDQVHRKAADPHRIELNPGTDCWTLFIIGERQRDWGFIENGTWVDQVEYRNRHREMARKGQGLYA